MERVEHHRSRAQHAALALENAAVFVLGGISYGVIELLWRGYTHWSMVLTGGGCLLFLYHWKKIFPRQGIAIFCAVSMLVITEAEFLVGLLVNLLLGWNVWDYSKLPFNLLGQICLPYSLLWGLLGLPIWYICRKLHRFFC